jgi:dTDP-glucose pyrophosphorylase
VSVDEKIWRKAVLPGKATLREAIATLNESGLQIVLILDVADILLGTVTDGDIRRGILRGITLDDPITSVMRSSSFVVPPEMSRDMVLQLMHANKLRQLPIVSDNHRVIGLHLWDDMSVPILRENFVLIMAGGLGTRMRPHTETCPKPMLPVAGKPMLEHIIERAKLEGFRQFVLAINYLGHVIEGYFGDGSRLGVRIDYLRETTRLGTAGALSILKSKPKLPFVVTNGDVLSDIKYGELLDFHSLHAAVASMAVRLHQWQHPFGVVQTRGVDIIGFEEKPIARSHINAGIYALSPEALESLTTNDYCDMPSLFEKLQDNGKRIVAYPMHEPWLDIGRPVDLRLANTQENKKISTD